MSAIMMGRGRAFVISIAIQIAVLGALNPCALARTCADLFQSESVDSRSLLFPTELRREKNPDLIAANIETYIFGQRIAVPYGLRPKDFDKMVRIFNHDPSALDAQGLIIFGSRTHFSYGTVPTAESDVDILVFGTSESTAHADADFISNLERTLSRAFNGAVEVNHFPLTAPDEFPPTRSFDWYLDHALNKLTLDQARDKWKMFFATDARSLADEYLPFIQDDPADAKNLLKMQWYEYSQERINKEAIFLIRQSMHSKRWIERLRAMGYRHIVEVPTPSPMR